MTHWKHALLGPCVASCLALSVGVAHAQTACRAGRSVDLTIELEPPGVAAHTRLEQSLAAELRARDLDVCSLGPGQGSVAHIDVLAPLPELSPTRLRIHTDAGVTLVRNLDVAALPAEARPSAIASAADELLSSLLQGAATSATSPATTARDVATAEAVPSSARTPVRPLPSLELGLGGGAARFKERGKGYQAELLVRWRPLPRLSATVRVGADRGSSQILDPYEGHSSGWHTGLDGGFELLKPTAGFGLAAQAGLTLAHVQRTQEWDAVASAAVPGLTSSLAGSSWEAAARLGTEASFHAGSFGVAIGLAALLPLTAAPPRPPGAEGSFVSSTYRVVTQGPLVVPRLPLPLTGLGEKLGGELSLRLWVALDSPG
jgi:hypothetical protein